MLGRSSRDSGRHHEDPTLKTTRIDRLLALTAALGLVAALWRWHGADPALAATSAPPPALEYLKLPVPLGESLAAHGIPTRNPFRLSNRMPRVRLGVDAQPVAYLHGKYRPILVLKAIVGGPPWTAVLGGVPGQRGDVLIGEGARVDSLEVRRISRDHVVLSGPDTTWVLALKGERP